MLPSSACRRYLDKCNVVVFESLFAVLACFGPCLGLYQLPYCTILSLPLVTTSSCRSLTLPPEGRRCHSYTEYLGRIRLWPSTAIKANLWIPLPASEHGANGADPPSFSTLLCAIKDRSLTVFHGRHIEWWCFTMGINLSQRLVRSFW